METMANRGSSTPLARHLRIISDRVNPSTYSMARKYVPSTSSNSSTSTMLSSRSRPPMRASLTMAWTKRSSCARAGGIIFSATDFANPIGPGKTAS